MKNIVTTSTPTVFKPVNISHLFNDWKGITEAWIKSWRKKKIKIESITAIYTSNKKKSRALENRARPLKNVHKPCSSPCWSYTVFTHVQRNWKEQIKGWKTLPLRTCFFFCLFGKCLKNLTGSQVSSSSPPLPSSLLLSRGVGRNLAGNYSTHHPLLRALRIWVTYFEAKLCCSCTGKPQTPHSWSGAQLSEAAFAMSLSRGKDGPLFFNTELWYCYSYPSTMLRVPSTCGAPQSTAYANFCVWVQ